MENNSNKVLFQKKEYVFAENLGVCKVEEITYLASKDGSLTQYYGLRSMQNESTTAYFPVEEHEVNIRALISEEEALKIINLSDEEKKNLDARLYFEGRFVLKLAEKIKKGKNLNKKAQRKI